MKKWKPRLSRKEKLGLASLSEKTLTEGEMHKLIDDMVPNPFRLGCHARVGRAWKDLPSKAFVQILTDYTTSPQGLKLEDQITTWYQNSIPGLWEYNLARDVIKPNVQIEGEGLTGTMKDDLKYMIDDYVQHLWRVTPDLAPAQTENQQTREQALLARGYHMSQHPLAHDTYINTTGIQQGTVLPRRGAHPDRIYVDETNEVMDDPETRALVTQQTDEAPHVELRRQIDAILGVEEEDIQDEIDQLHDNPPEPEDIIDQIAQNTGIPRPILEGRLTESQIDENTVNIVGHAAEIMANAVRHENQHQFRWGTGTLETPQERSLRAALHEKTKYPAVFYPDQVVWLTQSNGFVVVGNEVNFWYFDRFGEQKITLIGKLLAEEEFPIQLIQVQITNPEVLNTELLCLSLSPNQDIMMDELNMRFLHLPNDEALQLIKHKKMPHKIYSLSAPTQYIIWIAPNRVYRWNFNDGMMNSFNQTISQIYYEVLVPRLLNYVGPFPLEPRKIIWSSDKLGILL